MSNRFHAPPDASTLDIDYVSRLLARRVEQYVRTLERDARVDEAGRVHLLVFPQESAKLWDDIRRTLAALDKFRTDTIRTLREQQFERLILNPAPIWVGKLPKEPTT